MGHFGTCFALYISMNYEIFFKRLAFAVALTLVGFTAISMKLANAATERLVYYGIAPASDLRRFGSGPAIRDCVTCGQAAFSSAGLKVDSKTNLFSTSNGFINGLAGTNPIVPQSLADWNALFAQPYLRTPVAGQNQSAPVIKVQLPTPPSNSYQFREPSLGSENWVPVLDGTY